ncbi:hypothetical protein ACFX13_031410 [Malus domestica]
MQEIGEEGGLPGQTILYSYTYPNVGPAVHAGRSIEYFAPLQREGGPCWRSGHVAVSMVDLITGYFCSVALKEK